MSESYRFHFQTAGDPANPPVLLLHGFMGSCDDWQTVGQVLAGHFHMFAIDLPGHGKTVVDDSEAAYRVENTAAAVIFWLQEQSIDRPHCVGYSLGGRLALFLATHHSRYFRSFVVESASPGLTTEAERLARIQADAALAERLMKEPLERFLNDWYDQPMFAPLKRDPQKYIRLIHRRLKNNPHGLALSLRNMGAGAQPSLWEKLATLEQPLLLIVGERDDKFLTIAEGMVTHCQTAEIAVMSDCGHNVHFEDPKRFTTTVREFITRHN